MSRGGVHLLGFLSLLCFKFVHSCSSSNDEGKALLKLEERMISDPSDTLSFWNCRSEEMYDPCIWRGVECSGEGLVVAVDLDEFCLKGTLPSENGNFASLKSFILQTVKDLKKQRTQDYDYNNFKDQSFDTVFKRLLKQTNPSLGPSPSPLPASRNSNAASPASPRKKAKGSSRSKAPSPAPARDKLTSSHRNHAPSPTKARGKAKAPPPSQAPSELHNKTHDIDVSSAPSDSLAISLSPSPLPKSKSKEKSKLVIGLTTVVSVVCVLVIITTAYFCVVSKPTVRPWALLSGPLQVPRFSRSELEAGCEDFSNVIGRSPFGTAYKGTLTNGVEIAVTSPSVESLKKWSQSAETQFRSKIETLSRVNHKNFVNIVGYCDERTPFTRIMVFEYVSNGSLFDHLHMSESEHLNWDTRVRIMMGIAYCLEYLHEMDPPITVTNLASSAVFLTEDNAAKVADMSFASDTSANLKGNVYGFGVVMFEMITGRVPSDTDEDWAFDFVGDDRSLMEMLDLTLEVSDGLKVRKIWELMRLCVHSEAESRPTMKRVAASLREITGLTSDAAMPSATRMWWAEMAIMSPQTGV